MQSDMNVVSGCKRDQEQCPSAAAKHLSALVSEAAALQGRAKINLVHRSINRAVRYVSDLQQHGVVDVWSSPLATLAAAQGDCEDYAIAKYATLLMAGVKPEDLRILLVRDRRVGQDHAVLGVNNQGQWLILDNRWSEAVTVADVPQFTPLFAIDREGVKLVAVAYADNSPTPARSEERAAQRFEDTDDPLPAAADDNFLW
jgi:predicted transglutaminase-like cysteine proteinase